MCRNNAHRLRKDGDPRRADNGHFGQTATISTTTTAITTTCRAAVINRTGYSATGAAAAQRRDTQILFGRARVESVG